MDKVDIVSGCRRCRPPPDYRRFESRRIIVDVMDVHLDDPICPVDES